MASLQLSNVKNQIFYNLKFITYFQVSGAKENKFSLTSEYRKDAWHII